MNSHAGSWAGLLAAGVLLSACTPTSWPVRDDPDPAPGRTAPSPIDTKPAKTAEAPAGARPRAGNPPFYEVFGERYFVLPSSEGYSEHGTASWYGKPFHGRRTSSGEIYDMYKLTAAHKTLPLPSLVRVTSLDSGRSVVVRVNDRGPFAKGRLIDLSFEAARQLDIVDQGTGRVEVVAVGDRADLDSGTGTPAQRLFMQVGAFSSEANAAQLKSRLEVNGVNDVVIRYDDAVNPALYRVRIGPIAGATEYDALASRVASLGIANPKLVTESLARPGSSPP